jgi:hypothetical protein
MSQTMPRWVKGVEYRSMTILLVDFRKTLEREGGRPIHTMELNGTALLSDLCVFLGLSDANRRIVLGEQGARPIDSLLNSSIDPGIRK